ncbi:winged helix-turn-helix domain-containing protein [Streptacidiphilus melanogenes]|uniref:winged helix-turn-helix domain-containing protein n=1 Tax=Streptacidiphilus melanogenes TaxID=411235 RepID=UPI0005A5E3A1|nr:winged helix-turn-helix domain-containing protein [Streptacidiphilus melanogenes]
MSVPVLNPVRPAVPRLRSVKPDEPVRPGVYRLPPHVVSELQLDAAAGAPLVGYLVLVPEGVAPTFGTAPALGAAPLPPSVPVPGSVPGSVSAHRPATADADGLAIDRELRTVHLDGEQLELTYLEFELLAHLAAHPHLVHTRDRLVEAVWGYGHVGDGRTVDVHVARLRRKLGTAYRGQIVTVRRVGYKYVPPVR